MRDAWKGEALGYAGDVRYHKDPYTGEEITDAFLDAQLLAEAHDIGFAGRQPLEEALADYERQRNETALPIYKLTCQLTSLEPSAPKMQQLFSALRGNQTEPFT